MQVAWKIPVDSIWIPLFVLAVIYFVLQLFLMTINSGVRRSVPSYSIRLWPWASWLNTLYLVSSSGKRGWDLWLLKLSRIISWWWGMVSRHWSMKLHECTHKSGVPPARTEHSCGSASRSRIMASCCLLPQLQCAPTAASWRGHLVKLNISALKLFSYFCTEDKPSPSCNRIFLCFEEFCFLV